MMRSWRSLAEEAVILARVAVYMGLHKKSADQNLFTFAESCTGGLLASFIASVPGASASFPGSVVTYSNGAKIEKLSVARETIENHGAVSGECAAEMARGVLRLFGTRAAVSVTGIAGPDGGSAEKPVGTVWFGLALECGRLRVMKSFFPGRQRKLVQICAVRCALRLLVKGLSEIDR